MKMSYAGSAVIQLTLNVESLHYCRELYELDYWELYCSCNCTECQSICKPTMCSMELKGNAMLLMRSLHALDIRTNAASQCFRLRI